MVQTFEPRFNWLEKVDSTNTYCMDMASKGELEGLAVAAIFQENGRGQRGNSWESQDGMNLTFSLLLRPTFLRVEEQFALSKIIALSICEWINRNGCVAKIKWPNDIYVGDNKVCGILIENSFSGPTLDISVIGIGLNLNQTIFPSDLPNPTSMKLICSKDFQPEKVMVEVVNIIQNYYIKLKLSNMNELNELYINSLYRFGNFFDFTSNEGKFRAKIVGIKNSGELILETEIGQQLFFAFKEVSFII